MPEICHRAALAQSTLALLSAICKPPANKLNLRLYRTLITRFSALSETWTHCYYTQTLIVLMCKQWDSLRIRWQDHITNRAAHQNAQLTGFKPAITTYSATMVWPSLPTDSDAAVLLHADPPDDALAWGGKIPFNTTTAPLSEIIIGQGHQIDDGQDGTEISCLWQCCDSNMPDVDYDYSKGSFLYFFSNCWWYLILFKRCCGVLTLSNWYYLGKLT